jgi:acetoin utilization protein AcuB
MFVSDWMTKEVFTASPETGISEVIKMMKEHRVRHIPVVEKDRLVGMLSDRLIKEYTPSKATTLDIWELNYLLEKMKAKEVMSTNVIMSPPNTPIEKAAMILLDENIGCLPIVEGDRLVGIISDKDIFRALVSITGIRRGGHRFSLCIEDRPGSIKDVADIIRENGFTLQSILTSYEGAPEGCRNIVIRTQGKGDFANLEKELKEAFSDTIVS